MLLKPFIDFGTVLGKKAVQAFDTVRGVETPKQRPVSTSGFSFNFASGFEKLLQPIRNAFDPRTAAGGKVITSVGRAGEQIFDSLGRNISSRIDQLFGNANKKNESIRTNVEDNRFTLPTQTSFDLGEAFRAFSAISNANPQMAAEATPSIPVSNSGINTGLLLAVGAGLIGATFFLTTQKGR